MLRNYVSNTDAEELLAQSDSLAVLRFANHSGGEGNQITNRIAQLGDSPDCNEVFKVDGRIIESGNSNGCVWRRSEHLQFCAIQAPLNPEDDFEQVSYQTYQVLLDFIKQSPYPELVRFWNYIPNINHGAGDAENYKRFCAGRLQAFSEFEFGDLQFPAASAVGHYTSGMTVYAITAPVTAQHHANPRQIDAFKYPRQYGPASPSFARATTLELANQHLCFISGTASILGHSSVHRGDLRLQLYTTNDNILYLLKETGFKRSEIQTLRVYLRNSEDYLACKEIAEQLYPNTTIIYTHADICRSDLLVELECFCVAN